MSIHCFHEQKLPFEIQKICNTAAHEATATILRSDVHLFLKKISKQLSEEQKPLLQGVEVDPTQSLDTLKDRLICVLSTLPKRTLAVLAIDPELRIGHFQALQGMFFDVLLAHHKIAVFKHLGIQSEEGSRLSLRPDALQQWWSKLDRLGSLYQEIDPRYIEVYRKCNPIPSSAVLDLLPEQKILLKELTNEILIDVLRKMRPTEESGNWDTYFELCKLVGSSFVKNAQGEKMKEVLSMIPQDSVEKVAWNIFDIVCNGCDRLWLTRGDKIAGERDLKVLKTLQTLLPLTGKPKEGEKNHNLERLILLFCMARDFSSVEQLASILNDDLSYLKVITDAICDTLKYFNSFGGSGDPLTKRLAELLPFLENRPLNPNRISNFYVVKAWREIETRARPSLEARQNLAEKMMKLAAEIPENFPEHDYFLQQAALVLHDTDRGREIGLNLKNSLARMSFIVQSIDLMAKTHQFEQALCMLEDIEEKDYPCVSPTAPLNLEDASSYPLFLEQTIHFSFARDTQKFTRFPNDLTHLKSNKDKARSFLVKKMLSAIYLRKDVETNHNLLKKALKTAGEITDPTESAQLVEKCKQHHVYLEINIAS